MSYAKYLATNMLKYQLFFYLVFNELPCVLTIFYLGWVRLR